MTTDLNLNESTKPLEIYSFEDDNSETMIKVENVSMEFNMASEQLNNLKEYAIALAKGKLYFEKFTALDNVSFEVKRGDVFGILGTNGSGKSTMLKIIAGVLTPTSGNCSVKGNIAPLIELGAGFDMELSARENIYLNGALLGYSKNYINEHFDEIVEFAEIEQFLDMPMKNYSSGMVARIAFAIATVIVPDVLIVDEVLSVGDFMFQQKCENRISDLIHNHGVTVLIVSHSNEQIMRLCNKAIWIEKGHTKIIGEASLVCNTYRLLAGKKLDANQTEEIYKRLHKINTEDQTGKVKLVAGNTSQEISFDLIKHAWKHENPQSIILVQDESHASSIMSSFLSSNLDAPVMLFNPEKISHTIDTIEEELAPENVLVIANKNIVDDIKDSISSVSCVNIDLIAYNGSCFGIRNKLFCLARSIHASTSNEAYITFFNDSICHFLLAPIAALNKIPIVMFDCTETFIDKETDKFLTDMGITKLLICESAIGSGLEEDAVSKGYTVESIEIESIIDNYLKDDVIQSPSTTAYIALPSNYIWTDYATIASAVAKGRWFYYPVDLINPYTYIETFESMDRRKVTSIVAMGHAGLSNIDYELLCQTGDS